MSQLNKTRAEIMNEALLTGNEFYKSDRLFDALAQYNKALVYAAGNMEQAALCYSNRSAVYLKLNYFQHCLHNIALAEPHFPADKIQQLHNRRERCLKLMKTKSDQAMKPFDYASKLSYEPNPKIPFFIDAVQLRDDPVNGKYIITTQDLKAADLCKPKLVVSYGSDDVDVEERKRQHRSDTQRRYQEKMKRLNPQRIRSQDRERKELQRNRIALKDRSNIDKEYFRGSTKFTNNVLKVQKTIHRLTEGSRLKSKQILKKVAKSFDGQIRFADDTTHKKPAAPQKVKDVIEFYNFGSVVRQFPGKNDKKKVKTEHGTEIQQKKLMKMPVRDAYERYVELHPNDPVCQATFYKYRPANVELSSKTPNEFCICVYCDNMQFNCIAMNNLLIEGRYDTYHQLLDELLCDKNAFLCCANKCSDCKDFTAKLILLLKPDYETQRVIHRHWTKQDGCMMAKRVDEEKSGEDLVDEFLAEFEAFKLHYYIQDCQGESAFLTKKNLPPNSGMLIIDYSQAMKSAVQRSIQSHFFNSEQIGIFTATAFIGDSGAISFIIATDDTRPDKMQLQVHFYLRVIILDYLKVMNPDLDEVIVWSDGCKAQFKNFCTISNILFAEHDFGVKMEWMFFASCHGKSEADAAGGSLKRMVERYVTENIDDQLSCAADVERIAKLKNFKGIVFEVKAVEMLPYNYELIERWKNMKTIPGTMAHHCFKKHDDKTVKMSITSKGDGEKTFKMCK